MRHTREVLAPKSPLGRTAIPIGIAGIRVAGIAIGARPPLLLRLTLGLLAPQQFQRTRVEKTAGMATRPNSMLLNTMAVAFFGAQS